MERVDFHFTVIGSYPVVANCFGFDWSRREWFSGDMGRFFGFSGAGHWELNGLRQLASCQVLAPYGNELGSYDRVPKDMGPAEPNCHSSTFELCELRTMKKIR